MQVSTIVTIARIVVDMRTVDIKHDNILFRPGDLEAAVRMELAEVPSSIYGFTSEINPPVIPVRSQVLPLSLTRSTKWYDLDVVIADLGHCEYHR